MEHLTSILLGVRDDPAARPEELADWTVLESTTDVIHIERSLPLMHVTLVGRRLASGRRLTTILTYDRPAVARPLWAVIGIGHRWAVKRLLHHGVPEAPVTAIGATGQR